MDPLMMGEVLSLLVCSILMGEGVQQPLLALCRLTIYQTFIHETSSLEASTPFLKMFQNKVGLGHQWITISIRC